MFSLSDCINWDTNEHGDCGGRVEEVDGVILCETCRNRVPIKNEPVRYNGEKYRVRSVDTVATIQDIEGNTLTVNVNNLERGW